MNIRWRISWMDGCLETRFYEGGRDEPYRTIWSMGIAYDTIMKLGEMILVDTEEEERIMNLRRGG